MVKHVSELLNISNKKIESKYLYLYYKMDVKVKRSYSKNSKKRRIIVFL